MGTLATPASTPNSSIPTTQLLHIPPSQCLDAAKVARAWARAAQSVTGRSYATTSRVSPSPPSDVWLAVAVSSATRSHTLSTPSARPSPPSTLSTLSRGKAVPHTGSVAKHVASFLSSTFSINHLLHAIFTTRRYPSARCSWAEAGDGWRDTWVRMGLQTESGLALSFDHHAVT